MSFNGAVIKQGKVLTSDPSNYSARVIMDDARYVECSLLMPHGSGSNDAHLISMPTVGQRVLIIVSPEEHRQDSGIIIGTIPIASLGSEPSPSTKHQDKAAGKLRGENFRGEDYDDVYPGDISIRSKASRLHLSDDELALSAGEVRLEMSHALGGHTFMHTQADNVSHKNSLFNYTVRDAGGGSSPTFELEAYTQSADESALSTLLFGGGSPDTTIKMNSATPLEVAYEGKAAVSIDSEGRLLLKGKQVTIQTDGQVHEFGKEVALDVVYKEDIRLESEQNTTIKASGVANISGSTTNIVGSNTLSLSSGTGTLAISAGGLPKALPLPGRDQSLSISSPNGAIAIKAGSFMPSPGSLTKPGIRIQSEGGGDLHINSTPSPGGGFTTGSFVLDSALPASSAGSGGLGNYGIVLNSPFVNIGGIPGVADTPAGVPGPFGLPVPPVYDGFVKHFPYMTTYNTALLSGVASALAAAFPPTASASTGIFIGAFSSALASMSLPPVGRPISLVGIG